MTIQKARVILGKKAEKLTDDDISEIISFAGILAEVTISTIKRDRLQITS